MTAPVIELMGPAVGGIRAHVAALSDRLRAAGRDVLVAGPDGALGPDRAVDAIVEVPSGLSVSGVVRARRQLAELIAISGAQVVHAHGMKAGWVAVTTRPRPAVVLTAHNVVLAQASGVMTGPLRVLERRLVGRVDRLISPSAAIDAGFADLVAADRRFVIVPVSPPTDRPRPRAQVRAELGVTDEQVLVVVPARLHPQKDLATFVRAMTHVVSERPDIVARLVGDGPARTELADMIATRGLGGNVTLAGASPRAVDQIAAADIVALSSVWEAVPLVLVEAMSLGVPVVTTRVGISDELIVTGESGWIVDVGDDVAFGRSLLEAASDPGRRARVGQAAGASAARLADPDALAGQVDVVYRSLLAPVAR